MDFWGDGREAFPTFHSLNFWILVEMEGEISASESMEFPFIWIRGNPCQNGNIYSCTWESEMLLSKIREAMFFFEIYNEQPHL